MFVHGQDLRFALRSFKKDRSFFLASTLALALGIGSSTAIFSVLYNVVVNPFPYTDSSRIVDITIRNALSGSRSGRNSFSVPEFLDIQQQNHSFDRVMGVWEESVVMGDRNSPELLDTDTVTGNAFQFLGVPPMLGRAIEPSDAQPGAAPVFVLSYKVWQRRFGMDPSIVGEEVLLNGRRTTLIGIMPKRFAFWGGDIWMPATLDRVESGASQRPLVMYGHVKRGVTIEAAQADLTAVANRLAKVYRDNYPEKFDVQVQPLGHFIDDGILGTIYVLLAAVGLLLLIACGNVANLLLARAVTRNREFVLRMAMGASRMRLIAQLMLESLLLAMAGAGLGCLFASAGLKGLVSIVPLYTFPDEATVEVNTPVLMATIAFAVLTAFIFGLAPAVTASRAQSFSGVLNSVGRGNSSYAASRKRNLVVACEVALAIVLLSGAGLLIRSFLLERDVNVGVQTSHLLTTRLEFPGKSFPNSESQEHYLSDLLQHIERLPGAASVAAANFLPPNGGRVSEFDVPGMVHAEKWRGHVTACTPQLFDTLGMRLLAGRLPTDVDLAERRKVAVVNESMARRFFGGRSPAGEWLAINVLKTVGAASGGLVEIIGMVSDISNEGVRKPASPEAYIPYTIAPSAGAGFAAYTIFVRTSVPPANFGPALEREVLKGGHNVVPQNTLTMDNILDVVEYARPRFAMVLLSCFAGIGLVLVSLGVYSLVSYTVAQQQQEIGIRLALGAEGGDIRRLVFAGTLRLLGIGIAVGLLLTVAAGRALSNQIFGVAWYDPLTLLCVIAAMLSMGLLASLAPSMRAARVDPAVLLRQN